MRISDWSSDVCSSDLEFAFVELFRQEGADDLDLAGLEFGQFQTTALLVQHDRFLALADHLLQEVEDLLVRYPFGVAGRAGRAVTILDRGEDQPEGRHGTRVAATPGRFYCFAIASASCGER